MATKLLLNTGIC